MAPPSAATETTEAVPDGHLSFALTPAALGTLWLGIWPGWALAPRASGLAGLPAGDRAALEGGPLAGLVAIHGSRTALPNQSHRISSRC